MNIYWNSIEEKIPRIIGQLDRNKNSPTYGCFDRQFWHYKVIDFSCARMQEAALTLALIYSKEGNPYYNKIQIKEWSIAAIQFWSQIQDKDGSFSEWYPREHSFVATAFTTYAITETCLLLSHMNNELKAIIEKSADWLCNNNETEASNQQAGAIIALFNSYLITDKTKYKTAAEQKLKELLSKQTEEGWFPEYGGADIGYSSVLLDYLGKYYTKTKDPQTEDSCSRVIEFLRYFIHPDLSIGGEYGSRNTEYILPNGIEIFSENKTASEISSLIARGLEKNNINIDDRYLLYTGYCFLQAAEKYKNKNIEIKNNYFNKHFPEAGLIIVSTPSYYAVISTKKGGVIRIFDTKEKKIIYDDSGIIGKANNKVISTQWIDTDYDIKYKDNIISIEGQFHEVKFLVQTPFKTLLERFMQIIIGRSNNLSIKLKKELRKKLITKSPKVPIYFYKQIQLKKDSIDISTRIESDNNYNFTQLSFGGKFSLIYTPSTRYFSNSNIEQFAYNFDQEDLDKLNEKKEITMNFTIETRSSND